MKNKKEPVEAERKCKMEQLKKIIEDMGYEVKKGIGSDREIFVYDKDGNSIAVVLGFDGKMSAVSNRDVENETYPEYFEVDASDKDAVIIAVEYAMEKDRSFN